MDFIQLKIETSIGNVDLVSEVVMGLGGLSVTLSDTNDNAIYEPPVGENPLWQDTTIHSLFEIDADMEHVAEMISKLCSIEKIEYKTLANKKWEDECKKDFSAMQFGERLWVCPSWGDESLIPKGAVIIGMDPGLAFGTGTHETTRLCLEYLDRNPPVGLSVIDYGCGTGILAIGSAKLGASHVVAVDNDHQAVIATKSNSAVNNTINVIEVIHSSEESSIKKVDLLIANILANPLIELCEHFVGFIKSGGKITISGIIEEQLDKVVDTYSKHFSELAVTKKGIWCRLDGIKS